MDPLRQAYNVSTAWAAGWIAAGLVFVGIMAAGFWIDWALGNNVTVVLVVAFILAFVAFVNVLARVKNFLIRQGNAEYAAQERAEREEAWQQEADWRRRTGN